MIEKPPTMLRVNRCRIFGIFQRGRRTFFNRLYSLFIQQLFRFEKTCFSGVRTVVCMIYLTFFVCRWSELASSSMVPIFI